MSEKVYIFINGIRTIPGKPENWTDRAVTWMQLMTPYKGRKVEYFAFALLRWYRQRERAQLLVDMMWSYKDHDICLVGHSNGANVISRALKMVPWSVPSRVKEVHLFSPACKANFDWNGFNEYMGTKFKVYMAEKDFALKLASTRVAKLLGYGNLGRRGPVKVKHGLEVEVVKKPYKHSEWFKPSNMAQTMGKILG